MNSTFAKKVNDLLYRSLIIIKKDKKTPTRTKMWIGDVINALPIITSSDKTAALFLVKNYSTYKNFVVEKHKATFDELLKEAKNISLRRNATL